MIFSCSMFRRAISSVSVRVRHCGSLVSHRWRGSDIHWLVRPAGFVRNILGLWIHGVREDFPQEFSTKRVLRSKLPNKMNSDEQLLNYFRQQAFKFDLHLDHLIQA